MITVKNYQDKIQAVDLSTAPEKITRTHARFDDFMKYYGKNEKITAMVDLYIKDLNDYLADKAKKVASNAKKVAQNAKPAAKEVASKSRKTVHKSRKPASKSTKTVQKSTKTVQKSRKTVQKAPKCGENTMKLVESFSEDIRLIRRFHAAIGKERQRRSIMNIYRDIERRAVERKIGQDSPYAAIIAEIQKRLKKAIDHLDKNSATFIKLEPAKDSESFYNKVAQIAKSSGLRTSASLLKRFISVEGEFKPDEEKVERIHKAFESALKAGKVCNNDMYWKEFNEAKKEMEKYIKGDVEKIGLTPQSLNGLEGIGLGKPKATALNGSSEELTLSASDFRKMSKAELKAFTLKYYKENLKGKSIEIPDLLKEVKLSGKAGRKLTYGEAMYPEKAAIMPKLEQLIKNSTYNNFGTRKPKDNKDVVGYLNFKSKLTIDGEKKHVRISIELRKNKDTYFKNAEVGRKKKEENAKVLKAHAKSSNPTSDNRTSKSKNTNKGGDGQLSGIENESEVEIITRIEIDLPDTARHSKSQLITNTLPFEIPVNPTKSQFDAGQENGVNFANEPDSYIESDPVKAPEAKGSLFTPITDVKAATDQITLPGDLGKFLGYVERNEYSIVLRGDKGAGKSRMTYQMMNTFALAGFTCGCFSLEIAKDTNIVESMRNEYLHPTIAHKVQIAEKCSGIKDVEEAAKVFDVVVIDSWGKIPNVKPEDIDRLRKNHKNTMFVFIFQSTTNGTARGGSSSEYDAGMVIQIDTGGIAYCEKNRYSGENHKYLVFEKRLMTEEEQQSKKAS